ATRCRSTTRSSAATWGARWRSRGRWWRGSSRAPPRAAWSWWSTCRWGSATRTATPGARPTPRRRWRGCASSGCGASPSPTRWATPTPRAWRRCSTPSTRPAAWGSTCTRGRAPGAGSSRRRWRAGCAGSRGRWGAWAAARSRATSWSATCPPRRCCRSWRPRATRWGSTWGACRRWRPRPRRWRRASSRRRRVRSRASRSAGRVGDRRLAQARELARGGRRERRASRLEVALDGGAGGRDVAAAAQLQADALRRGAVARPHAHLHRAGALLEQRGHLDALGVADEAHEVLGVVELGAGLRAHRLGDVGGYELAVEVVAHRAHHLAQQVEVARVAPLQAVGQRDVVDAVVDQLARRLQRLAAGVAVAEVAGVGEDAGEARGGDGGVPLGAEQVDELLDEEGAGRLRGLDHRQVAEARVGAVVVDVEDRRGLVERHAPHASERSEERRV